MKRYKVSLTTNGSGAVTGYTPRLSGLLHSIEYVKDAGANPFANGVDFAITDEVTGKTLWTESDVNASKTCLPRAATHTTAGVAATLDGTVAALDKLPLANTRVKIVVAQGGDTKVGAIYVFVD